MMQRIPQKEQERDQQAVTTPTKGPQSHVKQSGFQLFSPQFKQQLASVRQQPLIVSSSAEKPLKIAACPNLPKWAIEREYLTGSFLKSLARARASGAVPHPAGGMVPSVRQLPPSVQELVVIEEILNAMGGYEGRFVRAGLSPNEDVVFTVDANLDPSLADLAKRMLPMCIKYIRVCAYVEKNSRFEAGLVAHAFCAAIRALLKEYLVLIAQLETQFRQRKLTIQKLWYYVQPGLRTVDVLERLTSEAESLDCHGGALLNLIHRRSTTMAGDRQTAELFGFLLEKASAPYLDMLGEWVYRGVIQDPYGEFLVVEKEGIKKEQLAEDVDDAYWEARYSLRPDHFPVFLDKVKDKILLAGKYLNVIRECGRDVRNPVADAIRYTPHEREYVEKIERAYAFASKRLLDLMMQEEDLMERLRSIKRFFLLDQADFFVHFMDIAESELQKSKADISLSKLESLLELSLRTSTSVSDPYKDDLRCVLMDQKLSSYLLRLHKAAERDREKDQAPTAAAMKKAASAPEEAALCGLEAFSFGYRLRWPLSLVVSRKTLTKYQMLFRHLFQCKVVERLLFSIWLKHQATKALTVRSAFNILNSLRQRMMHFLHNLDYFMVNEVIEPNWHILETKLQSATTIDQVLAYHEDFLDSCIRGCMLSNQRLFRSFVEILATCTHFVHFVDRNLEDVDVESKKDEQEERYGYTSSAHAASSRRAKLQVLSEHAQQLAQDPSFLATMKRTSERFDKCLQDILRILHAYTASGSTDLHFANLCTRLDYNSFYKRNGFYSTGDSS